MPIIICDPEWSDAATLTGSAHANFPLTNLQKMQPSGFWHGGGTSTPFIVADRGIQTTFNTVSLLFTNVSSTATWRIRTADTLAALTSSPNYDSGTIRMWASAVIPKEYDRHALHWMPQGQNRRFVRIDISDPNNVDGYIRAGRLYISNALQPEYNYMYGAKRGFDDPSETARLPSSQTIVTKRRQIPKLEFTLRYLNPDEAETLQLIRMRRGSSMDVMVCLDSDITNTRRNQHIFYGLMGSESIISNWELNLFEETVKITGLI